MTGCFGVLIVVWNKVTLIICVICLKSCFKVSAVTRGERHFLLKLKVEPTGACDPPKAKPRAQRGSDCPVAVYNSVIFKNEWGIQFWAADNRLVLRNSEDNGHCHRYELWDDKFHTRSFRRGVLLRHWHWHWHSSCI